MCFVLLHKTACLLCGHVFLASFSLTSTFCPAFNSTVFNASGDRHFSWGPAPPLPPLPPELDTDHAACRVSGSPSSFPFAHRCLDWFQSCDPFSFLLKVCRQRAFATVCSRCKPSWDYRREAQWRAPKALWLERLDYKRHHKGRKCGRAGTSEILWSYGLIAFLLIPFSILILEKTQPHVAFSWHWSGRTQIISNGLFNWVNWLGSFWQRDSNSRSKTVPY